MAQGGPSPPSESSESEASRRVLNDQDLETYPQNCVGKCFGLKREEKQHLLLIFILLYWLLCWTKQDCITVAHVLFAVKESKNTEFEMGIFVPSCYDR